MYHYLISLGRMFSVFVLAVVTMAATGGHSALAGEVRGRIEAAVDGSQAVVWIEGLAPAPVPKGDTLITHEAGKFKPQLAIGFVGNQFIVRNEDKVLHNTHLYMRLAYQQKVSGRPLRLGATLFNVALPKAGTEVHKAIKPEYRYRDRTGFIEAVCNRHAGEKAYVMVFDHPYAALTKKDGSFSIANVPAGNHEIRVFRDGEIEAKQMIEVKQSAPTEVVIKGG